MTDEEKAIEEKAKIKASDMLEKYKDAARLAEELAESRNEAFNLRSKVRELKATQPPADAVVLSGNDVKKWAAFNELGTPAELKAKTENAESAIAERDALKTEKTIARAAELTGYKPDVLGDLMRSKGFSLDVEGSGENAKAVARWKDGDKEHSTALTDYADNHLALYADALKAEPVVPARSQGVVIPRMAAPGGGKPLSLAEQIRAEEAAKKAPQGEASKVPTLEERMNLAPA